MSIPDADPPDADPPVDKTKILERVRKLLALSTSNHLEEARTSALLAAQLMNKHGLLPGEDTARELTEEEIEGFLEEGKYYHLSDAGRKGGLSRAKKRSAAELTRYGKKGSKARMASMSEAQRKEQARIAGIKSGEARRRKRDEGR